MNNLTRVLHRTGAIGCAAAVVIGSTGCGSSKVIPRFNNPHPPLSKTIDAFCQAPEDGIFAIGPDLGCGSGDVLIATGGTVRLGWLRMGRLPKDANTVLFRKKLPDSKTMVDFPLGKTSKEIIPILGHPTETRHVQLPIPIVGDILPTHLVYGRDRIFHDYSLFTTIAPSHVIEMRITVTYKKNKEKQLIATGITWDEHGDKELR